MCVCVCGRHSTQSICSTQDVPESTVHVLNPHHGERPLLSGVSRLATAKDPHCHKKQEHTLKHTDTGAIPRDPQSSTHQSYALQRTCGLVVDGQQASSLTP